MEETNASTLVSKHQKNKNNFLVLLNNYYLISNINQIYKNSNWGEFDKVMNVLFSDSTAEQV